MRVPRDYPPRAPLRVRKDLNADALIHTVRCELGGVPDWRTGDVDISMADGLMSGFALFSLKDPSLLAFEQRRLACDPNLHEVYLIKRVPCDTQLRVICDGVIPDFLRPAFRALFRKLQRSKSLKPFVFIDGHYLVSLDGTGFYSSRKVGSAACLIQTNPKTGEVTYSLQLLGACVVHPERMEVIPLFPEMITNGDGQLKNDCERNAAKRWLEKFRADHPHLKVIITEDALSPNAPHIEELKRHNCRFLLGVKPGDHRFLFDYVEAAHAYGLTTECEQVDPEDPTIIHRFRFIDEVPLNKSNLDLHVTFVEHWEIGPAGTKHFTWVTDLAVTTDNVYQVMRGGRARWRIENETFNTLKNQGYHFGHNFGLGEQHLAGVFTTLMMLAFLVDQIQQLCCPLFRAVWAKLRSKRALWEALRAVFGNFLFDSMIELYWALWYGIKRKPPELLDSS
jgi:hypothetical protein